MKRRHFLLTSLFSAVASLWPWWRKTPALTRSDFTVEIQAVDQFDGTIRVFSNIIDTKNGMRKGYRSDPFPSAEGPLQLRIMSHMVEKAIAQRIVAC